MGTKCLETFAPKGDKGVSSPEDISEASILSIGQLEMEGAIVFAFGLHSALLHLRFQLPPTPARATVAPWTRRGKGEGCEESIMELFKFVSNIEISFMPGELIIEVYRRTRRGLRMPGIVRTGGRRGGSELFVFRSTIVSYCPSPSGFLPSSLSISLSRLFILPRGNEDVSSASRRRLPFNFARSPARSPGPPFLPWKWPANRRKTVVLKAVRFVKSYRLVRGVCRVPRQISLLAVCIDMRVRSFYFRRSAGATITLYSLRRKGLFSENFEFRYFFAIRYL